jgi:hypothetical protein
MIWFLASGVCFLRLHPLFMLFFSYAFKKIKLSPAEKGSCGKINLVVRISCGKMRNLAKRWPEHFCIRPFAGERSRHGVSPGFGAAIKILGTFFASSKVRTQTGAGRKCLAHQ